ncbi:MAG: P-loop NTPase fold protein [Methanoregula sp.]
MDKGNDSQHSSQYCVNESSVHDFEIDYFGYKKVAKELASNIIRLDSQSGYVIAVDGKWGSGKSSFLFYTRQYLTDHRKDLDIPLNSQETIVFNFDPWLFSGHQDIVSQFFTQLKAQTDICRSKFSPKTLKVLNHFFRYGSHLKKVPTLEGQISGWAFTGINKIIESKIEDSIKSIFEIKPEIIKELQDLNEKIVIIIDDIDRLTSEDIRELFRAIKAIADFPNIVYLLAYDDEIVINSLKCEFNKCEDQKSTQHNSRAGLKYLEKIVQFSIPLPMIGESLLKEYTEKIVFDEKFKDTQDNLIESTRWTDIYHNGLRHFLRTPRNVIRLNNALLMLYPSVKNEVNIVDFISILILRQNYPELYNHIKDNHRFFIIDTSVEGLWFYRDQSSEILTKIHEDWINANIIQEDRKAVAIILASLFPEISPYIQHFFTSSSYYVLRSPKMHNISLNYDTFLKYFRFQSEPDYFSESELINILISIKNPDEFVDFITRLNSRSSKIGSKALTFFERILPLINEETPEISLENLIMGIFKIKNEVLNLKNTPHSKSGFRKNIFEYIEAILYKILSLYPEEKKLELLKKSYSQGTSFSLEAGLIIVIRQQNGDWEGGDWEDTGLKTPIKAFLNFSELKQIEEIYVKNIRNAFSTDLRNFSAPYLSTIILVWNKLSPNDPKLIEAIEKMWMDNGILIEIIRSSYENNYLSPISPVSLEPIKSEKEFREKVETILKTRELKDSEKTCLLEFLKANRKLIDLIENLAKQNS